MRSIIRLLSLVVFVIKSEHNGHKLCKIIQTQMCFKATDKKIFAVLQIMLQNFIVVFQTVLLNCSSPLYCRERYE